LKDNDATSLQISMFGMWKGSKMKFHAMHKMWKLSVQSEIRCRVRALSCSWKTWIWFLHQIRPKWPKKLVITASLHLNFSFKGIVWRTSWQVHLLCLWASTFGWLNRCGKRNKWQF